MSDRPAFVVRGVEIHSRHVWEWEHVRQVLELAVRTRLNTLVFHQNDLIDQASYSERYLPRETMKRQFPVYMHYTENNRYYLRKVASNAKALGIDFYLEVKELWYRTYLLKMYPGLMQNGAVCPNDPFWWDYLSAKVEMLFEYVPELAGIIVSPGSKESRLSPRNTRCTCERCRSTPANAWYRKVIESMYRPVHRAGKRLVLRDFVWSPKDLDEVVSAAEAAPSDVVISLKNTPHDYYPHFPHNPRIGNVGNHDQWIEYDVWGQYFGWGVFPCILLEDMKRRMAYARARGATGFIARTDWECISEGSAMDGLNLLNLYGAALLGDDAETDVDEIYRTWLTHPVSTAFSASDVGPEPGIEKGDGRRAIAGLRALFEETWPVMEKALYLKGLVFQEFSMFPRGLDDAWWMMEENQSLGDWDPSKKGVLDMTPENARSLIAEKEEALSQVRSLCRRLEEDENRMGLAARFYADLVLTFRMFVLYVEGFYHCARSCVLGKYALTTGAEADRLAAGRAVGELAECGVRLRSEVTRQGVQHYVYMLLDPDRINGLVKDLAKRLDNR